MTSQTIIDAARQNLSAVNDTFWSDTELLQKLYQAELQLSRQTNCIEGSHSDTSVAATATYSVPSLSREVTRVTFNGSKLQFITQRQADEINFNSSTSQSGTPRYYSLYASTMTFYPTPDVSALAIIIFSFDIPNVPTASSTPDTPIPYHDTLVTGLTYLMTPKDLGHPLTLFWREKWASDIQEVRESIRRKKVGDRLNIVQTEENALSTNFGIT